MASTEMWQWGIVWFMAGYCTCGYIDMWLNGEF